MLNLSKNTMKSRAKFRGQALFLYTQSHSQLKATSQSGPPEQGRNGQYPMQGSIVSRTSALCT